MSTATKSGNPHRTLTANDKAEILALIYMCHEAGSDRYSAAASSSGGRSGVTLHPASGFDGWESPIELESRDLKFVMSDDGVVCHGFLRMSGTRKNLRKLERFWLRETMSLERRADGWRITNADRSVPFYRLPVLRRDLDSNRKLRVAWAS